MSYLDFYLYRHLYPYPYLYPYQYHLRHGERAGGERRFAGRLEKVVAQTGGSQTPQVTVGGTTAWTATTTPARSGMT